MWWNYSFYYFVSFSVLLYYDLNLLYTTNYWICIIILFGVADCWLSISRELPLHHFTIPRRANQHRVGRVPTTIPHCRSMVLQLGHLRTTHLSTFNKRSWRRLQSWINRFSMLCSSTVYHNSKMESNKQNTYQIINVDAGIVWSRVDVLLPRAANNTPSALANVKNEQSIWIRQAFVESLPVLWWEVTTDECAQDWMAFICSYRSIVWMLEILCSLRVVHPSVIPFVVPVSSIAETTNIQEKDKRRDAHHPKQEQKYGSKSNH